MHTPIDIDALADRLRARDRRALARAITLIESSRDADRETARALLGALGECGETSLRIGLSGPPGVGKSTFIEGFGKTLLAAGRRVAVLAVDPSSSLSGGSILGDKTRMDTLARARDAFIRPSPSGGTLGGVARRTRESIRLCEAAGFDAILVETVGVGQSETAVADMTDIFALLVAPGGGDELQGVKRGVMELADLVIVNKADGDLAATAERTRADYAGALRLFKQRGGDSTDFPQALAVSALEERGFDTVWQAICTLSDHRAASGLRETRRADQALSWMASEIDQRLWSAFERADGQRTRLAALRKRVTSGEITPDAAAQAAIEAFLGAKARPEA